MNFSSPDAGPQFPVVIADWKAPPSAAGLFISSFICRSCRRPTPSVRVGAGEFFQKRPTSRRSSTELLLLFQRFRCLEVMLQGWQRLFRKIGERALRLRLFLVFPDVLLV